MSTVWATVADKLQGMLNIFKMRVRHIATRGKGLILNGFCTCG